MLARASALMGWDVHVQLGLDDHQTYAVANAITQSRAVDDLVREIGDGIVRTWTSAQIRWDRLWRPAQPDGGELLELVRQVLTRLKNNGFITTCDDDALILTDQNLEAYEAFVQGRCPHCGAMTGGNGCENCGLPNRCTDLLEPQSRFRSGQLSRAHIHRPVLELETLQSRLSAHLSSRRIHPWQAEIWIRLAQKALYRLPVLYRNNWGLCPDHDKFPQMVVFTPFETAAINAAPFLERPGDPSATDAPNDRKFDEHVVLHGIDNVFNGMILVPAILIGAGYDDALPTHYIANHFYLLEGKKFSTSRNHAIWADDFIEKHGIDAARIYLCKTAPEYSQTNFSSSEFAAFCAEDLAGRWGSWWQFVLDDCLPGRKRGRRPGPDWQRFYTAIAALRRHLSPYDFSVSRAFVVLDGMVSVALDRSPDKAGQIAALHAFAVCLWPIAPCIAESILSALGHPNPTAPSWPTTERSMAVLKVPSAPAHEKINDQIAKWKSIRSA